MRLFTPLFAGRLAVSIAAIGSACASAARGDEAFQQRVAPIFERRCVACHNDEEAKGELSLQTARGAQRGGESGAVIAPGEPDASLLIDYIAGDEPLMPKTGPSLSADEVESIRQWIARGAHWPADLKLADRSLADKNWWSLAPLVRPPVPALSPADAQTARTPVDAFIIAKLREQGLDLSPPADRRTLARRLYFDLLGLPPAPEEMEQFVNDPDPQAYEKLVDRLLASPRYGERWARHWLDVVHYADTHGYDKDKLRENAWPYRDYVIRALNGDKPYARFVQEQLAGDTLHPHTRDGIVAQGFISAGPWDFVGHAEVPETKIDGRIARHLDRDDMVATTTNTFLSMTAQCAQCHRHKFDPITQHDYYSLQSVFAALDRADRPYDPDPQVAARRAELTRRLDDLSQRQSALNDKVREAAGDQLAQVEQQIDALQQQPAAGERPEFGYHSQIETRQDLAKWVQVDLGAEVEIAQVVIVGCHDDYNNIGAGFGFPSRFKIEASSVAEFSRNVQTIADCTNDDVANPGVEPQSFSASDLKARYIRVTAVKLAPRSNDYIFALAELSAFNSAGENISAGAPVASLDSIEAPVRWQRKNLVDGYYYGMGEGDRAAQLAELRRQHAQLFDAACDPSTRQALAELDAQIDRASGQLQALPPQQMVYAGAIYTGSGAFSGTGAGGGQPREIRVLHRGDVRNPGELVSPGAVALFDDGRFDLPPDHGEGERRAALARWIVDERNPLTWRSIVNRVWQYHFDRGIVATPNDFGRMGERPTHPELLDWLAVEFRDRGQSLKALHRLIVASAVYRQSSADHSRAAEIDGANRFLWRMNRQRLDAESVHDAALAVAGKLKHRMYGPGFHCFEIEKPEHSPHYQYDQHDPSDPAVQRRAIYRFIVRSAPDPFMETLDCADPSQLVAKRNETVTPLQALALLNNKFMLYVAEQFAARLQAQQSGAKEQIALAYELALGRAAEDWEQRELAAYARQHGLANACRVILNLNEFVFVD